MTGATILVVDDAREIREFVADAVLRPSGYRVLQADSGTAALEIIYREHPDLIISDIVMPGITGLELAQAVQREWPGLPVILVTAEGSEQIAQRALRAGVVDYFIKPFDPEEMLQAVERGLARLRLPPPSARPPTPNQTVLLADALARLDHRLAGAPATAEAFASILEAAVAVTGADEAVLFWLDDEPRTLSLRATHNLPAEVAAVLRANVDAVPAGAVLSSGQLVRRAAEPLPVFPGHVVQALAYAPVPGRDQPAGVLGVHNRRPDAPFDDQAAAALQVLGVFAGRMLASAQHYAAVEAERAQLLRVLNEIEDGVIVVDDAGQLILMNHAARRTFGVERVHVAGLPLADLAPQVDLLALLAGGRRVAEIALDDGRTLNAQSTPIATVGRAILLHDISQLKEIDRIKSEFVTTVSHDLRSPLTSILGYVSLLDRVGTLNERQAEFIQQVRGSVNAMNTLLTELLDLGRIEAGLDAQREPLALGALTQQIVNDHRLVAHGKSQILHPRIAGGLPPVLLNATRFRQMLANLLDNALKYTPEKGQISVEVYAEGDFVVLAVIDNGIGIPPADQPYIFDKFFRAANVRGQYPGTGLGLSIVKSIVDQHGGRIWVDSRIDEGATFTVMLPQHRAE